jgi:hypothetical protein
MRRLNRSIAAALVAVSLLLLSACSDGDETSAQDQEQSGDQQQTEDAGGAGRSEGASGVQFDPEDVLVEQTYSLTANPEDKVTVGLQSLVVDGQVMTLTAVVTPDFSSVSDSQPVSLYDILERDAFRPTLLDRENLKEYSVINDGATWWESDAVDTQAPNGSPMRVFATFAAPEDDIDIVDVSFRNVWTPFTHVPIER